MPLGMPDWFWCTWLVFGWVAVAMALGRVWALAARVKDAESAILRIQDHLRNEKAAR